MLGQILMFFIFISSTESCFQSPLQVPHGEPFFVKCSLEHKESEESYNITWYKNGTQTEVSTDPQARIHQVNNFLKFFPAQLEDSGYYSCVRRDAKGYSQEVLEVNVFQNDNGLCYKSEALYNFKSFMDTTLRIQCPCVTDIVDVETAQFLWFKDCKPLDLTSDKYQTIKDKLIVTNVTLQDAGKYTCITSFTHNETKYNISRSIEYLLFEMQLIGKPIILYPTDNFIEAKLGAPITVTCKALSGNILMAWNYNGSFISEYSNDDRVMVGIQYEDVTENGQKVTCQNVTFSSVIEEDYCLRFHCVADNTLVYSSAFVILKKPDPNHQVFLIAFFVTATFFIITTIIVIKVFKVDLILWYRSSCFSHPQQNDSKMYDAYIIYPRNAIGNGAYDMDIFVFKLLPEVLEKLCAYRLFIIGRDDIPGQAIADLADKAISQSRRLIIVLGQVSSEANLGEDFEQKIAMYDALIRNEIKVILIEMEKITDYTFMPESIKYIRQKQGVVRWKETFTEASLSPNTRFWKNIRYRMPPAPRHSAKDLDYLCTDLL
ncbi:interleukin-1 receptor type 1-like [Mantella aurantiaca]